MMEERGRLMMGDQSGRERRATGSVMRITSPTMASGFFFLFGGRLLIRTQLSLFLARVCVDLEILSSFISAPLIYTAHTKAMRHGPAQQHLCRINQWLLRMALFIVDRFIFCFFLVSVLNERRILPRV